MVYFQRIAQKKSHKIGKSHPHEILRNTAIFASIDKSPIYRITPTSESRGTMLKKSALLEAAAHDVFSRGLPPCLGLLGSGVSPELPVFCLLAERLSCSGGWALLCPASGTWLLQSMVCYMAKLEVRLVQFNHQFDAY